MNTKNASEQNLQRLLLLRRNLVRVETVLDTAAKVIEDFMDCYVTEVSVPDYEATLDPTVTAVRGLQTGMERVRRSVEKRIADETGDVPALPGRPDIDTLEACLLHLLEFGAIVRIGDAAPGVKDTYQSFSGALNELLSLGWEIVPWSPGYPGWVCLSLDDVPAWWHALGRPMIHLEDINGLANQEASGEVVA